MDPLSIAAASSSLVVTIVKNGRALATLYEKYQDAQRCIFLVQTECTVLAAALSQLQLLFSNETASGLQKFPASALDALDLSLLGCTITFSVLSKEIESLVKGAREAPDPKVPMGIRGKAKYLWKEESMNELLQQLRGQSAALTLLLKAFDSQSIDQILRIVTQEKKMFQGVKKGTETIRREHPEEDYAESIFAMTFDETQTIHNLVLEYGEHGASTSESVDQSFSDKQPTGLPSLENPLPEGWIAQYHAQYKEWYYINHFTKKSQWERPTKSTSHHLALRPGSSNSVTLEPVSPAHPQQANSIPPQSSLATAETLVPPQAAVNLDFRPWTLSSESKFHQALKNLMDGNGVAGLGVGVVSIDQAPKIHTLGVREKDSQGSVTRNDKFLIANGTSLASTLAAILVDRRAFTWEETVLTLFPWFAERIHILHHQTTLAMICSHQTGIDTLIENAESGDLWTYCVQSGISERDGRLAITMSYLSRPPDHSPGTTHAWQCANMMLLILAMEERAKQPYETLIKRHIFDPLEMYSAGIGSPDADRNGSSPQNPTHPWGHDGQTKRPKNPAQNSQFSPACYRPVNQVCCSIPDYAAFISLQLRASKGMETSIASPSVLKRIYTRLKDDDVQTVGAWILATRDWAQGEALMTNGRSIGFALSIWIAPLINKAYFAIVNVDGDVGLEVADRAVWLAIRNDQS